MLSMDVYGFMSRVRLTRIDSDLVGLTAIEPWSRRELGRFAKSHSRKVAKSKTCPPRLALPPSPLARVSDL